MLKKCMAVIIILSLFAVITGCSKGVANKEEDIKEITITTYPDLDVKRILVKAKEKFESENTNIKINIEEIPYIAYRPTIEERHEEGNPPDIILVQPEEIVDYGNSEMLIDLNGFLNQDSIDRDETFYKLLMDRVTVNGQLTAIPLAAETWFIVYNEKRFQDAGIPEPSGDWTWEEVADIAQKMKTFYSTESSFSPIMIPFDAFVLENLIISNGGAILSEDGLTAQGYLDSEASVSAIQWLVDLITKDQLAKSSTMTELGRAFTNQKGRLSQSAMFVVSSGYKPYIPLNEGYKVAELPYFANGIRANTVAMSGLGISTKSQYPQEAWAFIKEFTINDTPLTNDMVENNFIATRSVLEKYEDDPIISMTLQEYEYVKPSSRFKNHNFYTIYFTKLNPALRKLISDADNGVNVNVKDTLTDITRQIEDDLKNEKYLPMPGV